MTARQAPSSRLSLTVLIPALIFGVPVACDGPRTARPSSWEMRAAFPAFTKDVTGIVENENSDVYMSGSAWESGEGERAAVFYYDGIAVAPAFMSPYESSHFSAVNESRGVIWACGYKTINGGLKPYVVRNNGGVWRELAVPDSVEVLGLADLYPVGDGSCWFLGNGRVYLYDGSTWEEKFRASGYDTISLTVTESGRAFIYDFVATAGTARVLVSDDYGDNWCEETIRVPETGLRLIMDDTPAFAPVGEGVALLCKLRPRSEGADIEYEGIIIRDGSRPRDGEYSIAFMAPHGPYYYQIFTQAYRSTNDGYAVGSLTSVALENGVWQMEIIPDGYPGFELIAAGSTYYWAVTRGSGSQPPVLWRTP